MEVFLSNVPGDIAEQSLTVQLKHALDDLQITDWSVQKPRGKRVAHLAFLHKADGDKFLESYSGDELHGSARNQRGGESRARSRLQIFGETIFCRPSPKAPEPFLLKALAKTAKDRDEEDDKDVAEKGNNIIFALQELSCGHYEYTSGQLVFCSDMEWPGSTQLPDGIVVRGQVKFSKHTLVVEFHIKSVSHRLEIPFRIIHEIVASSKPPALTLTLWEPPRFFRNENIGMPLDIPAAGGARVGYGAGPRLYRTRISELPHDTASHGEIMGQATVYKLAVAPADFHLKVEAVEERKVLTLYHYNFPRQPVLERSWVAEDLKRFKAQLERLSTVMPFAQLFQFQALVQNGYLLPHTVGSVIDKMRHKEKSGGGKPSNAAVSISAQAIKKLQQQIPFPGPYIDASTFDVDKILETLERNEEQVRRGIDGELRTERARSSLVEVYKVRVTPSQISLSGPELEAQNRILRKFPAHLEYFARVQFCDEDGQDLFFNARVSLDRVWERFKAILLQGVAVAGRRYQFLGFSHSSLRAHSVWFSSPFVDPGGVLRVYFNIIAELGDFTRIRSPAKSAARIGQSFSETPYSLSLQSVGAQVEFMADVQRGDRVFSDGVGTVSRGLMEEILKILPAYRAGSTCFQFRWAGAKGMLSLDETLPGVVMRIRPDSMVKFQSNDRDSLEICDSASRPIPLMLNRQLIKIMEDMGCADDFFIAAQRRELKRLQMITGSVDNTVEYLRRQRVGGGVQLHRLVRRLHRLNIDYRSDRFLCSIIEAVVLRDLRLLKHKARIPVEKGVTLFGVMDEFDFLDEDEIFITFEADKFPGAAPTNFVDLDGCLVIVTRSPALHPGDVQLRTATVPPEDHPLRALTNCVVFSQRGSRDLPSQLSGGDLDGDIYNIIWDGLAVSTCAREFPPADYPRQTPLDIGRQVQRDDMTDFFVQFMATDQLGLIATKHMILADQKDAGTVDRDCQALAELHSTGVDYSKTGIPVDMSKLRSLPPTRYRPDFLAPAPPANIKDRTEIAFDAPPNFTHQGDDDDSLGPVHQYYNSEKVLGKLYRAIDERKIWKEEIRHYHHPSGSTKQEKQRQHQRVNAPSIWKQLLESIEQTFAEEVSGGREVLNRKRAMQEAKEIREAYDDAMFNAGQNNSENPVVPISELEIVTGFVFNKSGVQTRRQRDTSAKLKDEFDRISRWVEAVICRRPMQQKNEINSDDEKGNDNDHKKDDAADQDEDMGSSNSSSNGGQATTRIAETTASKTAMTSPLELAMACLDVGSRDYTSQQGPWRFGSDFQSFKVVAAHCSLKELDAALERAQRQQLDDESAPDEGL